MRVRYTPRARGDIAGIADYLVERSPAGARAVEARIRWTVQLLADYPKSGRPLEQRRDVRVMPVVRYPYLIFYRVDAGEIVVLHIRHGARNPIKPDEL
jgi:plasmid stabilization system protein ParE